MIRVAIVDSSPIYARGLASILASEGFQTLGDRATAIGEMPWRADVFLADLAAVEGMTLADFLATAARIAPVLLLGSSTESMLAVRSMRPGAAGYVDRRAEVKVLLSAVRTVVGGGQYWETPCAQPDSSTDLEGAEASLSPRERQVLRQIARGLTHGQIARRLSISPHTVDTYVKRIRFKLDLGNKAELTRAAVLGHYDTEREVQGDPRHPAPHLPRLAHLQ